MTQAVPSEALRSEDVRQHCGGILDWKLAAILESGATLADLEVALAYLTGAEEAMGEAPHPLSGAAARVYDLLAADEEFPGDQGPGA